MVEFYLQANDGNGTGNYPEKAQRTDLLLRTDLPEEKARKRKQAILFAALALVLLNLAIFIFLARTVEAVQVFPADVFISEKPIGINLDKDKIHFGLLPKNAESALRKMVLQNNGERRMRVIVRVEGELRPWTKIEVESSGVTQPISDFYIEPQETKTILLSVVPKEGAAMNKMYEGEIKVIFLHPFLSLV